MSLGLSPLEVSCSVSLDDMAGDCNSVNQVVCLLGGKKLSTARYWVEESETFGSIEDYLIAIKHEQILSQELNRKSGVLEDLYKEMQSYITVLFKEYQEYPEDPGVDREKERHIQDCQLLKNEYTKFNRASEDIVGNIRELREELSAIN